ncbi:hypothetical protein AA0488_1431 [Kozakia baliensis NRIC 0488]|nr:hypothetical protein AA0488_1431 [Kozakia baliensis NRIC 0488]
MMPVAEGGDANRIVAFRQCAQAGEIEMIVMTMRDENRIDARKGGNGVSGRLNALWAEMTKR